jgi:hypothetical protein
LGMMPCAHTPSESQTLLPQHDKDEGKLGLD